MNFFKRSVALSLFALCNVAYASSSNTHEQNAKNLANRGDAKGALVVLETPGIQLSLSGQSLRVYLLTDMQQFEPAVSAGQKLVQAYPKNAGAHLAYAYSLRHSGKSSLALKAYQDAAALEPTNPDALVGQVLMMKETGIPVLALELAVSKRVPLPRQTLDSLHHAKAIQLIRLAPTRPDQLAVRTRDLDQAIAVLRDLQSRDASRTSDLIAALARNRQYAEAITRFEQLEANGGAPQWLYLDAAASYMGLKRYDKGISLYQKAYQETPTDPEIWEALFYAYSDVAQFANAQKLIDKVVDGCEKRKCNSLEDALALQMYSRLWASDLPAARSLIAAALAKRPSSISLKNAYVSFLTSAGYKYASREQIGALLTQTPDNIDLQLASLSLNQFKTNGAEVEAELTLLESTFPGNGQVARARKEWERTKGGNVSAQVKGEWDSSSSTRTSLLAAESSRLNSQGARVVAEVASTDWKNGAQAGKYTTTAAGVAVPVTVNSNVAALVVDTKGVMGGRITGDHAISDKASVSGAVHAKSGDVPLKALNAGVRQDKVEVSGSYRVSDAVSVGATVSASSLSDGNNRTDVSASARKSGAITPDVSYVWTNRAGVSTSSKQDVEYFSPSQTTWAETELEARKKTVVSGANSLTVAPRVGLGVSSQAGYDTKPTLSLGTTFEYLIGEDLALVLDIGVAARPYDGEYSVQRTMRFGLVWSWY